jgi:pilus assembly protein CpaB
MGLQRILLALGLAAVVAGGSTSLLYKKLKVATPQRQVIKVVAAAEDLPVGVTLAANNLVMLDWPADVPINEAFNKNDDVVGRPLIFSVGAKQPILKRDLGVQGSGIGLASKIPPGMRATAVRSNEIVGVAGFLYPGSRVDVLATYTNLPGANAAGGALTQTVLQDVEVLTAGQTIEPDPQGKPQTVNVVTVLLTPEDSQKLLLASQQGTIQFVLRSGVDQAKVQIASVRMGQLVGSDPGPLRHSGPRTPVRTLEVIQGTQRSVQKF